MGTTGSETGTDARGAASAPAGARRSAGRARGGLRERKKLEKRERIRRAARALFIRKGFEATTARAICERAGIGTGTLFLYVKDKRELLQLVFDEDARALFARGRAEARRKRSPVERLMALFGAFIGFYAEHPALSRAILQELLFREHAPEGMGALTAEYGAHVAALVRESIERGELRDDVPVEQAAMACFAHYAFWIQGWLGTGLLSREQAEAGLRAALTLQIEGLAPAAARSGR